MPTDREILREHIARAIWKARPDAMGKPWPIETEEQQRAYPHNPIAAVDLCYAYADAAMDAIKRIAPMLQSQRWWLS